MGQVFDNFYLNKPGRETSPAQEKTPYPRKSIRGILVAAASFDEESQ
jgi:hypothetical protein